MRFFFLLILLINSHHDLYGKVIGFKNQYVRYCYCPKPGSKDCGCIDDWFMGSASMFFRAGRLGKDWSILRVKYRGQWYDLKAYEEFDPEEEPEKAAIYNLDPSYGFVDKTFQAWASEVYLDRKPWLDDKSLTQEGEEDTCPLFGGTFYYDRPTYVHLSWKYKEVKTEAVIAAEREKKLRKIIAKHEATIKALRLKIDKLEKELKKLKKENKNYKKKIEDLEKEQEELKDKIADLESEIRDLNNDDINLNNYDDEGVLRPGKSPYDKDDVDPSECSIQ